MEIDLHAHTSRYGLHSEIVLPQKGTSERHDANSQHPNTLHKIYPDIFLDVNMPEVNQPLTLLILKTKPHYDNNLRYPDKYLTPFTNFPQVLVRMQS